ncbi:MAG: alpha-ribazole phosphatase family protein [Magnetococcus sp. WYHC-3]
MNAPVAHSSFIDLLRHGQPQGGERLRGRQDDPLDSVGWIQMHRAVAAAGPWQRIHSSPLRRCAEFARVLAEQRDIPLTLDERLGEMDFGQWQGQSIADILEHDGDRLRAFWRDPTAHHPPGGEPLPALAARLQPFWDERLAAPAGERVLVVAHSGVLRVLVALALTLPLQAVARLRFAHAARVTLRVDHHRDGPLPRLLFPGASEDASC